jgi:hypothetical protein
MKTFERIKLFCISISRWLKCFLGSCQVEQSGSVTAEFREFPARTNGMYRKSPEHRSSIPEERSPEFSFYFPAVCSRKGVGSCGKNPVISSSNPMSKTYGRKRQDPMVSHLLAFHEQQNVGHIPQFPVR